MKLRETLLLIGTLVVLAAAGLAVLSLRANPAAAGPAIEPPARPAAEPSATAELPPPVAVADLAPPEADDMPMPALPPGQTRPEAGIIDGSIQISSEVAGKFTAFTIEVAEEVNPNLSDLGPTSRPFFRQRGFKADPSRTPRFLLDDIPFSPYGYRVTVFVPGFNGSSQVVQLTEESWVARVHLALSGGVPFSVRLHDQHRHPCVGRKVTIAPDGRPHGRARHEATSDSYGTVVFEDVLAGDYLVSVDDQPVQKVQVQASALTTGYASLGVQSAILEVPTGVRLRIEVTGPAGYGIENADVRIYAIDTIENRRLEAKTDWAGIHEFPHLAPGKYQLDVSAQGFLPTSRTVPVDAEGQPEPVKVRLTN